MIDKSVNEAEFLARVSEILQRAEGQYKPADEQTQTKYRSKG